MAGKRSRIFTFFKWLTGIVLFLILAGGAASWYISVKYKPEIAKILKDLVIKSTDSLYHIEFSQIHTNFLTGGASVSDVVIVPDTNIYQKLVKLQKAPNNIYRLKLKKLSIRHFHPLLIYYQRKLNIDELLFDRPQLVMINKHYEFNENRPPRPRVSPYTFISKFLTEARVKDIRLKDISFKYINNNGPTAEVDSVSNLNIYLSDYLLDKTSAVDTTRMYLFKDVRIALNNYSYETDDKMYRFSLEQLDFTAKSGKLNIKKFAMQPLFSEMEFGRKAGYARDRFNIAMNDISLDGILLPLYVRKQELFAQNMNITNGSVEVFSDGSLPKKLIDKTGRFPHQLLQKLRTQLTIKKILLNNIMVSYSEFDHDSRQRGKITFERTAGTISNATNAPRVKQADPVMKADLTTWLMGKGQMHVSFNFNLLASNGAFSYDGLMTNMDGRVMNRITKPLGMLAVNRLKVKSLAFKVNATDDRAKGIMAFNFNNLSVSLLKKDKESNKLVKKGLISFLANNLVLSSENPGADSVLIKAPINYKRPVTSSFFSYVWRMLFSGIKYSVGVTPAKEAKIKAQVAQFEKMKADRNIRRENREKRQELRNKVPN